MRTSSWKMNNTKNDDIGKYFIDILINVSIIDFQAKRSKIICKATGIIPNEGRIAKHHQLLYNFLGF